MSHATIHHGRQSAILPFYRHPPANRWEIPCVTCKARRDERCRTKKGKRMLDRVHWPRRLRWIYEQEIHRHGQEIADWWLNTMLWKRGARRSDVFPPRNASVESIESLAERRRRRTASAEGMAHR